MIKKDINYYLEDPQRLLKKKPFTRGGEYKEENVSAVKLTTKSEAKVSDLDLYEISQDAYIQEYTPSLHKIKYNKSIPHIAVKIGDSTVNIDDMTITCRLSEGHSCCSCASSHRQPDGFLLYVTFSLRARRIGLAG